MCVEDETSSIQHTCGLFGIVAADTLHLVLPTTTTHHPSSLPAGWERVVIISTYLLLPARKIFLSSRVDPSHCVYCGRPSRHQYHAFTGMNIIRFIIVGIVVTYVHMRILPVDIFFLRNIFFFEFFNWLFFFWGR